MRGGAYAHHRGVRIDTVITMLTKSRHLPCQPIDPIPQVAQPQHHVIARFVRRLGKRFLFSARHLARKGARLRRSRANTCVRGQARRLGGRAQSRRLAGEQPLPPLLLLLPLRSARGLTPQRAGRAGHAGGFRESSAQKAPGRSLKGVATAAGAQGHDDLAPPPRSLASVLRLLITTADEEQECGEDRGKLTRLGIERRVPAGVADLRHCRPQIPEPLRDGALHVCVQALGLQHIPVASVVEGVHQSAVPGGHCIPISVPRTMQRIDLVHQCRASIIGVTGRSA
mmetsp:Transcript_90546/g.230342  ORF Transcript_90546/g.230342 Transcript_90546/m.230342 type:complete len:284 (-) Transcript_90546:611-1462(-)